MAHAHNDHLELLAGGGLARAGLFAWFVTAVLLAVAHAARRRRDPAALTLASGAAAGCVAFLVHGASDFSLAIGANALMFFFLLGLAVSASHTRAQGDEPETLLSRRRLPAATAHAALAAALAVTVFHAADLAARQCWRLAAQALPRQEPAAPASPQAQRLLGGAARLQPLDPRPLESHHCLCRVELLPSPSLDFHASANIFVVPSCKTFPKPCASRGWIWPGATAGRMGFACSK